MEGRGRDLRLGNRFLEVTEEVYYEVKQENKTFEFSRLGAEGD